MAGGCNIKTALKNLKQKPIQVIAAHKVKCSSVFRFLK